MLTRRGVNMISSLTQHHTLLFRKFKSFSLQLSSVLLSPIQLQQNCYKHTRESSVTLGKCRNTQCLNLKQRHSYTFNQINKLLTICCNETERERDRGRKGGERERPTPSLLIQPVAPPKFPGSMTLTLTPNCFISIRVISEKVSPPNLEML